MAGRFDKYQRHADASGVMGNYVSEIGDALARSGRDSGASGSSQAGGPERRYYSKRGLTRKISPSAGGMIMKIFFLMKIIHRIGILSFRQEKSFHENPAGYRIFFTLRQLGRRFCMILWTSGSGVSS
jgi:hypothetical protein